MRIACALLVLCAFDDWGKISGAFKTALENTNDTKLQKAVADVAKDNSERAAKLLLGGLKTPNSHFYWLVIEGLGKLGSKEAVAAIADAVLAKATPAEQRRDLLMALQVNRGPWADDAMLRIAKEGAPEVQVTAIDELVSRGKKEAIQVFIDLLKSNEAELKRRTLKALVSLTGHDAGAKMADWQAWWDAAKETWKAGGEAAKPDPDKPGKTVAEIIRRNRTTDFEDLKKGGKTDIVIVEGVFDRIQLVLDHMKIPYTKIVAKDLAKHDLSKTMALVINCGAAMQEADPKAGELLEALPTLTKAATEKVRDFTARGGYVFTSDWGLSEVLEGAFPGYCKKAAEIGQATVKIFPKRGATGHPLLKEVFVKVKLEGGDGKSTTSTEENLDFQWIIDMGTYTIDYDPAKVTCLIEAPDLADPKHRAVAVTFSFGEKERDPKAVATGGVYEDLAKATGGRVLHVLSHFGAQKSKNDEYAIQNMLLNFLIEAKDRKALKKR